MNTEIFDLGKIGITLGGEYDNKVIYEKLTIVLYKGKSYISTKTTQGISPEQNILTWQLVAEAKDAYHMLIDAGKIALSEEEFLEQLVDASKGRFIVQGNITNAADEEDLTVEHSDLLGIDTLKLANRDNTDGMGYVILRKNKSFAEQVTKENTIYEIRYDFDLNGEEITIPEGCTLKFNGGSISGNNVTFNNAYIDAIAKDGILNVIPTDTITNDVVYPEWFKGKENHYTYAIRKAVSATKVGGTILFTQKEYYCYNDYDGVKQRHCVCSDIIGKTIKSNCKSKLYTDSNSLFSSFFNLRSNSILDGLCFDLSNYTSVTNMNMDYIHSLLLLDIVGKNIVVRNCLFISCGSNTMYANGHEYYNILIENNECRWFRIDSPGKPNYDSSIINIKAMYAVIQNNKVCSLKGNKSNGGIEFHSLGICANNIIDSCSTSIYVCLDIKESANIRNESYVYDNGVVISNNIIKDADPAISLWAEDGSIYTDGRTYEALHDILITGNNIINSKRSIVFMNLGQQYKNITIVSNKFEGSYRELSSSSYDNNMYAIVNGSNKALKNVVINGNHFIKFPFIFRGFVNSSHNEESEIVFTNNIFEDCLNYDITQSLVNASREYTSLIYGGSNTNIIVTNNVIKIKTDLHNQPRIFVGSGIFKDNILNIGDIYTGDENSAVDCPVKITGYKRYEQAVKTQTNTTLREGDVLLDGNIIKRCSKAGTVGPALANTKVVYTGNGAYFTCDNPDDVKIGDYLIINRYKCNVIAKIDNKIFVSNILYNFITTLPINTPTDMTVNFNPYTVE